MLILTHSPINVDVISVGWFTLLYWIKEENSESYIVQVEEYRLQNLKMANFLGISVLFVFTTGLTFLLVIILRVLYKLICFIFYLFGSKPVLASFHCENHRNYGSVFLQPSSYNRLQNQGSYIA